MRRLAGTTRGRLTLIAIAFMAAALVVADSAVYVVLSVSAGADLDEQLRGAALAVSRQLTVSDGQVGYSRGTLPDETAAGTAVDLAVVGPHGVALQTPGDSLPPATLLRLAGSARSTDRPAGFTGVLDSEGARRHVFALPLTGEAGGSGFVLVASTPSGLVDTSVRRAMVLVSLLSAALLVAAGLLVHWVAGRALRPVSEIVRLAGTLGEGDLHRRVDVRVPDDELGDLVTTFNRMLDRLEASFEALRRFTADASHELRTPLALMAAELERTSTGHRSDAEREQLHRLLRTEVAQMTGLVERLLLMARADAGELEAHLEPVDVADLIHETAARWQGVADERGVELEVVAPDGGEMLADPVLARRVLDNLLDNAVKHSPGGGRVRLRAEQERATWLLEVADQGPGVAAGKSEMIFDRFARLDGGRHRQDQSGAGLGLSLAQFFSRVQGGRLSLVEAPGWGAMFQLRLPGPPVEDAPPSPRGDG